MSNGFVHSVRVPCVYKTAARIVEKVSEDSASLKDLIYGKKIRNITNVYRVAATTLQNAPILDRLLQKSGLLLKETRLDPWLARVLIMEMLWGNKGLKSECKPVQTILSYEEELRSLLQNFDLSTFSNNTEVKKPRYVRVNTLVASIDEMISSFTYDGWIFIPKCHDYSSFLVTLSQMDDSSFIQDFHIPELLVFPPGTKFYDDRRYQNGAIILQDKASCFPAFLLKPEPGSTVLDMCAAPGMKTTHLAAIMENKGKIYAIEKSEKRYETLRKLVDHSNTSCVKTMNADALTIGCKKCPDVEYILVDPSCSGSGITDRSKDAKSDCPPERLKSLQSFQVLILRHALFKFPSVKRVVYSTCSIFPEENEMVVDEILADIGQAYNLVSVKKLLEGNWKNFSGKNFACKDRCLYARPETDHSNGFFIAVFERDFDVPLPNIYREKYPVKTRNGEEQNDAVIDKSNDRSIKKNKKKTESLIQTIVEDTKEICEALESVVVSEDKKTKSKKRRRMEQENAEFINAKTDYEIDMEEPAIQMEVVKKKKKKKEIPVEASMTNESIEDLENPEQEVKSKKKKRKRRKSDTLMEIVEDETSANSTTATDQRKKKKKSSDSPEKLHFDELSVSDVKTNGKNK